MAMVSARVAADVRHDDNRRSDLRTEINRAAVLRLADGAYDIRVEDLTREGCKITTVRELDVGSVVTLGFAGVGHTTARVIWREGQSFGCIFENQLPSGAVTAATLNNVDSLQNLTTVTAPVSPEDVKWSRGKQLALIAGSSVALWAVIVSGFALIF